MDRRLEIGEKALQIVGRAPIDDEVYEKEMARRTVNTP